MEECVYKAIQEMILKMKQDIARTQNIQYSEQIIVAEIYNIVAENLAQACRACHNGKLENCAAGDKLRKHEITEDTFIMLKQITDEKMISEEYSAKLFDALLKMNPSLKEQVEKDRSTGLI